MQNEDNSKCLAQADYLVATTGASKTVAIGWKTATRIGEDAIRHWLPKRHKGFRAYQLPETIRLDYEYRICRLSTRKGPSIWMDDCPANEWIKRPHSERTPIATRNDKACTIEQGSKHTRTYAKRGLRMVTRKQPIHSELDKLDYFSIHCSDLGTMVF